MSSSVVQAMFHKSWKYYATDMYEHIFVPSDENGEQDIVMGGCEKLRLLGATDFTDATHIAWSRCPRNSARLYTGKEG